jgi:uncharacterized membrane protein
VAAGVIAAVLDPYVREWLDLLLRGLHVIAGIVWIGTSFYFVALDNHLAPPKDGPDAEKGVGGEAWEIHGGGFYRVEKYRVAPRDLPEHLIWFKWEAYTTWLSGFALMVVFYYLDAETYLVDASVADLPVWAAIAISVAGLALAWVVYDALCRVVRDDRFVLLAGAVLVAAATWGTTQLLSPRAAFLQVGAMLGTIMVANVFFNIIPAHWDVVRAKEQGREPAAGPGLEAKRRSVHNNYLTLPVVLAMIGNHFPFVYANEHAWLAIFVLMALGAWIRHFFNLRHGGNTVWWIPVTAAAGVLAVAIALEPDDGPAAAGSADVEFAEARQIVERRCTPCHSSEPTQEGITAAPAGIRFDTAEQIAAQADAIRAQAVDSRAMPLGNVTGMTDEEREQLGAWIEQGASTE